ncbi:hypothetical protein CKO51_10275 [Rhodopirellula sp. SM50]|nr:hypothetical protein CKO51_10275 [Rhodopirellula sp. SM50]
MDLRVGLAFVERSAVVTRSVHPRSEWAPIATQANRAEATLPGEVVQLFQSLILNGFRHAPWQGG